MRRRQRRIVLGAVAAVVVVGAGTVTAVVLSGGDDPTKPAARTGPRPLTETEADRLAVARFDVYRHVGVHFRTSVLSAGQTVSLEGYADYRRKIGYALAREGSSGFQLEWNATTFLAWPITATTSLTSPALPATAPAARTLQPTATSTDAVLSLVLELGQDRPDNAQLIRQGGAQWLRTSTLDGTAVDVIQGPAKAGTTSGGSAVTYWLDRTATLRRVDVHLGGGTATTQIDLDAAGYVRFPASPRLGG